MEKKVQRKGNILKVHARREEIIELCWHMAMIKTKFIRKLSNFNFQWTKTLTLYQLSPSIAFFLALFKGYKCTKLYERTPKKRFSWEQEKIDFKFHRN